MNPQASRLIDTLGLRPHPEGGWFRETYRSPAQITTARGRTRSALTAILFLLPAESFSAFHRLESDETWHFYRGDPIAIEAIDPAGTHRTVVIGQDAGFQATIAAGTYFAAHVDAPEGWALVGCSVGPGFEYEDFIMPSRAELVATHPQFRPLIERYTR